MKNKTLHELERALLFLEHKDSWNSKDNEYYEQLRHAINDIKRKQNEK